jgi:hypothetical protein
MVICSKQLIRIDGANASNTQWRSGPHEENGIDICEGRPRLVVEVCVAEALAPRELRPTHCGNPCRSTDQCGASPSLLALAVAPTFLL